MRLVLPLFLTTCLFAATEGRAQSEQPRNATTDTTDAVSHWLASNAVRLETVEAGSGFDDLQGLRDVVGDARLVLLGEPTHGNREVYQLKHRMIEFLVEEMGFSVLILETPMPESFEISEYVRGGTGDPETALAAAHVWAWDTEEVAEMIAWMRRTNAERGDERQVSYYGFDMQSPERAARVTLDYLDRVDPNLASTARARLGHLAIPFSDPEAGGYRPVVDRDYDASVQEAHAEVSAALDANRGAWSEATGSDAWERARQHARVLGQWIEANRDDGRRYGAVRDSSMAENIRWILEREGPDARAVVWTHNTHASDAEAVRRGDGSGWAGRYLRRVFGDEMRNVGFLFNQGRFTALEAAVPSRGVMAFEVGPAHKGTIEARFAAAGLDLALVDLRDLPEAGPVAAWFSTRRPTQDTGGGYNVDAPERYFRPFLLPEAFDALVYVDETTPTRLVEPADQGAFPVLRSPINLDFEHGVAGEPPAGWVVWSKLRRYGFQVETTDERPYSGRRAAVIHRAPGDETGEASGSVLQRIDAAPYRGRRIRLRAAARADLADRGLAFLRLRIHPPEDGSAHDMSAVFYDSLDEHRVMSSDWRVYEVVAEVPEGADMISFGLYLAGTGSAWLDAVSIEVEDNERE